MARLIVPAAILLLSTSCAPQLAGSAPALPPLAGTWVGREGTSGGEYRDWTLVITPENLGAEGGAIVEGSGEIAPSIGTPCRIRFVATYDETGSPPLALVASGADARCAEERYYFYGALAADSTLVTQLRQGGPGYAYVRFSRRPGSLAASSSR
ncbi:MAG: hypothetical protein ACRENI_08685 [Gemmatimonadaceae bacterium]